MFLNGTPQSSPSTEPAKGNSGDVIAIRAPIMNIAPTVLLVLVIKSLPTCTLSTLPEMRLPESSSSLTVTVASPLIEGNKLCQTILVLFVISWIIEESEEGLNGYHDETKGEECNF